jgi:hypothetical protein
MIGILDIDICVRYFSQGSDCSVTVISNKCGTSVDTNQASTGSSCDSDNTKIIGAVIGVVVIDIVLILIVAAVVWMRQRQKRRISSISNQRYVSIRKY